MTDYQRAPKPVRDAIAVWANLCYRGAQVVEIDTDDGLSGSVKIHDMERAAGRTVTIPRARFAHRIPPVVADFFRIGDYAK